MVDELRDYAEQEWVMYEVCEKKYTVEELCGI